jgi:hypothetical protein
MCRLLQILRRSNRTLPEQGTHTVYNVQQGRLRVRHAYFKKYQYGKIDDIMERNGYSRKGRMMNIEENFYIYLYKHNNTLIDEQKIHEINHSNILLDRAMQGTRPSLGLTARF